MRFHFISVEGPPGVGKTALAERLGGKEGSVVLEEEGNPFLHSYYTGKPGAAFQTQMFFLLSRYRQLSELSQRELFHQFTVCDFLLAKDKIFAYLNLDDTELALYEKIYGVLASEVPSPELVIYLQAPAEVLNKRLKGKSRKGEPGPKEDYLRELVKAYDYFFFHYSTTPLLIVNTADVDFSDSDTELDDLLREIDTIEGGTRFFKPARGS
jgi:deoxyadenosine/deoxycytidine kinase